VAMKGHCHVRGVLSGSSHISWSSILSGLRMGTEKQDYGILGPV